MRRLPTILAALTVALLAGGWAGALHPAGDTLSILRPQAAAVMLGLAGVLALLGQPRRALAAAAIALAAGAPIAAGFVARDGPASAAAGPGEAEGDGSDAAGGPAPATLVLYQKNLLAHSWPRKPLAADILLSGADVVTLQEVSAHNLRHMPELFAAYPTQVICPFSGVGDVAVLSRLPAVPGSAGCGDRDGMAVVRLALPGGDSLWVASLHLHWPWPYRQPAQVAALLPRIAALDGPVLLAGDFNMVPWGASVRAIAQAVRAERAGPYRITYPRLAPALILPIDHILIPVGSRASVEVRPLFASDHRGLLARIDLPAD